MVWSSGLKHQLTWNRNIKRCMLGANFCYKILFFVKCISDTVKLREGIRLKIWFRNLQSIEKRISQCRTIFIMESAALWNLMNLTSLSLVRKSLYVYMLKGLKTFFQFKFLLTNKKHRYICNSQEASVYRNEPAGGIS